MEALPSGATDPRAALEAVGALPDTEIDLAAAAVQLARIDAPEADWRGAMETLSAIARDAVLLADPGSGPGRGEALAALLGGHWGFAGDRAAYDHPDNANLIRVLERKRGLPVALGIVWLHAAAASGWPAHGIDFPAHFLLGLEASPPVVLDVFDGGTRLEAPALRALLKRIEGPAAELRPGLLRPMGPRAVLLRLANNLKLRRQAAGDLPGALACVADMLRIAPDHAALWREAGLMHQRLDQVAAALRCLDRFLALVPEGAVAERTRATVAELRARLN